MYFQFADSNVRVIGAMHMLPIGNPNMPDWVYEAYEWCDAVVFECDPATMLPLLRKTRGLNIQECLSPLSWTTLNALWPKVEHFPDLDAVQPWAVLLFSSVFASRTADGVEPQFLRWAADQSKPVHFLESAAEVVAAFDTFPLKEVFQAIEHLASDISASQKNLESMYSAWINQDLHALYDVALKSPGFNFPSIRQAVLERRNQAWVPALLEHLKSPQRTLVAVGALHLYGPGNLFQQVGKNVRLVQQGG